MHKKVTGVKTKQWSTFCSNSRRQEGRSLYMSAEWKWRTCRMNSLPILITWDVMKAGLVLCLWIVTGTVTWITQLCELYTVNFTWYPSRQRIFIKTTWKCFNM